ncbi:MAG: SPOR domain-containing protein [Treponema sp.]|nr:SPOR domain-containing protein [Treponema sp.]
MKRVILPVLLHLLIAAGFCMAQTGNEFNQRGIATQEMQMIDGLYASHPSLPIGSRIIVINTSNNASAEVTIIGRILASSRRIIDLSPDSALALGIDTEDEVILSFALAEPELPKIVTPDESDHLSQEAEPELKEKTTAQDQKPQNRKQDTVYIVQPETRAGLPEFIRINYIFSGNVPKQKNKIFVIPGLPNPCDGKLYNLQIGAFSAEKSAHHAYRTLQTARFDAVLEQFEGLYRVYATRVPAIVVSYAVNRLEDMGFTAVWIRELGAP